MSMSIWIIISWVVVAILTGINIFVFFKLKNASDQMLKMAFPNAKNMNEALSQMQSMMGAVKKGGGRGPGGYPGGKAGAKQMDAKLKAAMDLLKKQ